MKRNQQHLDHALACQGCLCIDHYRLQHTSFEGDWNHRIIHEVFG